MEVGRSDELATGSRSVTSVFSIAVGSASPSDMPQTSCSFGRRAERVHDDAVELA